MFTQLIQPRLNLVEIKTSSRQNLGSVGEKMYLVYAPTTTARNPFELYYVKISRKYVASLLIIMQRLEIFPYRHTQFHTNS